MDFGTIGSIASIIGIPLAIFLAWYWHKKSKDDKYKLNFRQLFIKENYWTSTKKLQDGEIAPFVFLSVEVIRDKEYYKNPPTGSARRNYDQKLFNFQAWIESHIPHFKKEHKWNWIGHQGFYGFLDSKNHKNNSIISTSQKVVQIGEDILKALPTSAFNGYRFRLIVHSSVNDIQFRTDMDKRLGVALDFLYDISIPSDEINLYLTKNAFNEIGNNKKNNFVSYQFEVLQTELFSYKSSTINSLQTKMKIHLDNGEIVYAADLAHQLFLLSKNFKSDFSEIVLQLESVKNTTFPIDTLRFLYKSFLADLPLQPEQKQILNEYKVIERAINYSISELERGWNFENILLCGKSPQNYLINSPLVNKVLNEKAVSVHKNCCLCTANLGLTNILINREEKAAEIFNWLKKQKKMQYRSQDSQLRDWRYTAEVLDFAIMMGDEEYCHELFNLLINAKNWLENSEHGSLKMRGSILSSLCKYFEKFSFDRLDSNSKYQEKLIREVTYLYKGVKKYQLTPFALVGLKGLVSVLKIGLTDRLNIDYDLKKMTEEHVHYMINNSIWDEETGSWGFGRVKTIPMIMLWFEYWQYKLSS